MHLFSDVYRFKVDMTKYLDCHAYKFDNCFDAQADNQEVSVMGSDV